MKRKGILNSHISKVLADLGHTDLIAIADAGLPIPDHVHRIDLALTLGIPSYRDVVNAITDDMVVEKVTIASEMSTHNRDVMQYMQERFINTDIQEVSHEEFKRLINNVKAVIRTGEVTPYANCILQAGVIF